MARTLKSSARSLSGFSGVREVQQRINEILDQTKGKEIKKLYLEAGGILAKEMKERAPYDPDRVKGKHLRDGVFVDDGLVEASNVIVGVQDYYRGSQKGASTPHAHLIEEGFTQRDGKFNPGHPFVRPSISAVRDDIRSLLKKGFLKFLG